MAKYLNFDVGTLLPYLRFTNSFALLIAERKDLNNLTEHDAAEGKVKHRLRSMQDSRT